MGEKQGKPIRRIIAVTAYRLIWWPVCVVLIPLVAIGAFVDWLSWTAFPALARVAQPVVSFPHNIAFAVAGLIYGATGEDSPANEGESAS